MENNRTRRFRRTEAGTSAPVLVNHYSKGDRVETGPKGEGVRETGGDLFDFLQRPLSRSTTGSLREGAGRKALPVQVTYGKDPPNINPQSPTGRKCVTIPDRVRYAPGFRRIIRPQVGTLEVSRLPFPRTIHLLSRFLMSRGSGGGFCLEKEMYSIFTVKVGESIDHFGKPQQNCSKGSTLERRSVQMKILSRYRWSDRFQGQQRVDLLLSLEI